jgi:hypothetical protein
MGIMNFRCGAKPLISLYLILWDFGEGPDAS